MQWLVDVYQWMHVHVHVGIMYRDVHMLSAHVPGLMPEVLPGLSWQCFLWHSAGTQVAVADLALLSVPRLFLPLHVLSQQCHHTCQIHVDCYECCMYIGCTSLTYIYNYM